MPARADEISANYLNGDEIFGQLPNQIEKFGDLPKSCLGKSHQVPCPEIGKKMRFSEEKWLLKPRGFAERHYRTALADGTERPSPCFAPVCIVAYLETFPPARKPRPSRLA